MAALAPVNPAIPLYTPDPHRNAPAFTRETASCRRCGVVLNSCICGLLGDPVMMKVQTMEAEQLARQERLRRWWEIWK